MDQMVNGTWTPNVDEQALIDQLRAAGQQHLFADWDEPGTNDDAKRVFLQRLTHINQSYPGGLTAYIGNARKLLAEARLGTNPFKGFVPNQPDKVDLTHFDESYDHYEAIGIKNFDKTAFVLVAGGLGERLGYSGIKLDIPVEVTQNTPYLAHYAANLKAMEARMPKPRPVPLIIMVSEDTDAKTRKSLEAHNYFGLKKEQVHILKQELAPAIADNDGRLALKKKYELILKPHGHGDIHMLLHSSGIAAKLTKEGIEHFVFVQDTNGQAFNAIPAALGASVEKDFAFNSIAVNRIPGEAVGALTKLIKGDTELTLNIEYNQLDPLLRATISPEGDVPNDEGFSIFPGNINILIIEAANYVEILDRTAGVIAEFVNPKYADEDKNTFKKPTRLETMMQDLPKLFGPDQAVGVTIFDRRWSFSANKNNIIDAAAKAATGGPPESGASAEADFYFAGCQRLQAAGVKIIEAETATILGIPMPLGPRVILRPSFALTLDEVRSKIKGGSVSGEATLILNGKDITLEDVDITAGSGLVIDACDGAKVRVRKRIVDNPGFELVPLTENEQLSDNIPEYLRIRGYHIDNIGAEIHVFTQPGEYTID